MSKRSDNSKESVTVDELLNGGVLSEPGMDGEPDPMKLTISQRIALTAVSQQVRAIEANLAKAKEELVAVMQDCGLDPRGQYEIAADGTVVVR